MLHFAKENKPSVTESVSTECKLSSKVKTVTRSLSLPRELSLESERGISDMVATLQSRKEALEAKIVEKNEELKKLCLQEADLTGVMPPEIPLEPGEPPPTVRRRVGTSFSFPQNLINSIKDADDESLRALELECKVQTNIAEAALTLANDTTANKAARRKHRLMYRQSQRRLIELETRLNLLKQGKFQQPKPQQIKKKPRPNTTAVENLGYFWNKTQEHSQNSWSTKTMPSYSMDEVDNAREFSHGSLHRSFKSSGTSQSSDSPRIEMENEEQKPPFHRKFNNSPISSNHFMMASSFSHPNIQDVVIGQVNTSTANSSGHHKRSPKRGIVRRQWDTQSAGGTLLPNQTYPDHSHQPNLSRTQSLGSMEANSQRAVKDAWSIQDFAHENTQAKEKEWYETALDSAPSPPLRTSSRLPPTARMLYHMQEMQMRDLANWNTVGVSNVQGSNPHIALTRTQNLIQRPILRATSSYNENAADELTNSMQQIHLATNPKVRSTSMYVDDNASVNHKEFAYGYPQPENRAHHDYTNNIPKQNQEQMHYQQDAKLHYDGSGSTRFLQNNENRNLMRQNSLNLLKYKTNSITKTDETEGAVKHNDAVYINIPEDSAEISTNIKNWINETEYGRFGAEQPSPGKTPTKPYFHMPKTDKIENLQYQAARNREDHQNSLQTPAHLGVHPPHAITQSEITFDTVVPFESPQNHTVVQAGKWQPYREVSKPFEMADFYKYSTKFRQNQTAAPFVQEGSRGSPHHHRGVYKPLKPMTCQPVEAKPNPVQFEEMDKQLPEVSSPEIV